MQYNVLTADFLFFLKLVFEPGIVLFMTASRQLNVAFVSVFNFFSDSLKLDKTASVKALTTKLIFIFNTDS